MQSRFTCYGGSTQILAQLRAAPNKKFSLRFMLVILFFCGYPILCGFEGIPTLETRHCWESPENKTHPYGCGSKLRTPGEHQNRWHMDVHPPQSRATGYAPWPCRPKGDSTPHAVLASMGGRGGPKAWRKECNAMPGRTFFGAGWVVLVFLLFFSGARWF